MALSLDVFSVGFNEANQPDLFKNINIRRFDSLPVKGEAPTPWSGDYWPTYRGGISYRWKCRTKREEEKYAYSIGYDLPSDLSCLSPSEKFDLFMNDREWTLTRYERNRTEVMKTIKGSSEYDPKFEIPKWEGICHAWAPATIAYENPKPIIVRNKQGLEIPFGSSDLKALLAYGIHLENSRLIPSLKGNTKFAGERCSEDFKKLKEKLSRNEITQNEYEEKLNSGKCGEDINAGTFHLIVTNRIGILKKAFIIDQTRDDEVWNQPIFDYEIKNIPLDRPWDISRDAAEGTYSHRLVEVKIKMIVEVPQTWNREENPRSIKEKIYKYYLDLDYNGNIIGGKWVSTDRPDFVWAKEKVSSFESILQNFERIYKKSLSEGGLLLVKFRDTARTLGVKESSKKLANGAFLRLYSDLFGGKNWDSLLFFHILDVVDGKMQLDLKLVKRYLDHKANPNARRRGVDASGILLLNAVKIGNLDLLKILVEAGGDLSNDDILKNAVKINNVEMVNYLLEKGSKTYWEDSDFGPSKRLPAIFNFSFAGQFEMLRLFLMNGQKIDINMVDTNKESPLFWALEGMGLNPEPKFLKTIQVLLEYGSNINLRNEQLYSPLSVANRKEGPVARRIERMLISRGAKI